MKQRKRVIRGSTQKLKRKESQLGKELLVIVTLFFLWLGLAGFATHYYINLQNQTVQLRRECSEKLNKIILLKNDIASLEVDVERLQCEPHIRYKIRQYKLALRPTVPHQALSLHMRSMRSYSPNERQSMLVDREGQY